MYHSAITKAMTTPIFKWIVVALGLLPLSVWGQAHTGRYEIVKGKGIEVCEKYRDNLNSFPWNPYDFPMRCERKIDPKFSDFSKPKWEELNASETLEMTLKVQEFLEPHNKSSLKEQGHLDHLKNRIKRGVLKISKTHVDIDNDGNTETLIRYRDGDCELGPRFWGAPILLLNKAQDDVDPSKTKYLLQNRHKSKDDPIGRWSYAAYDVFIYKGKYYFDRWSDSIDETGFLKIFKLGKDVVTEVCRYQYKKWP